MYTLHKQTENIFTYFGWGKYSVFRAIIVNLNVFRWKTMPSNENWKEMDTAAFLEMFGSLVLFMCMWHEGFI